MEASVNEIKIVKSAVARLERAEDGSQIIILPEGFELPETEITARKEGDTLILEPKLKPSLREFLDSVEPVDIDWPDVDEGLLPLDDIKL